MNMNNTVVQRGNDFEVIHNNTNISEFERCKPVHTYNKILRLEKDITAIIEHIEKAKTELAVLQSQFKSMKECFLKGE